MKRTILIAVGVATLAGAVVLFGALQDTPSGPPPQSTVPPPALTDSLESQTDTQGGVTVAVTPKNITESVTSWDFEVVIDTHSTELNDDMALVSSLVTDDGKTYAPISWEGSPSGGHHREGTLKFTPASPRPRSLTLRIRAIGGIPERIFTWEMK